VKQKVSWRWPRPELGCRAKGKKKPNSLSRVLLYAHITPLIGMDRTKKCHFQQLFYCFVYMFVVVFMCLATSIFTEPFLAMAVSAGILIMGFSRQATIFYSS
jgi:hypothetical protein